jgi:hypothetical protein
VLNRLQLPTDVVFLIVLWRLRMKLSLRDLAEILLLRGLVFSPEAIRDWEAKLAPLLTEALRWRRKGKASRCQRRMKFRQFGRSKIQQFGRAVISRRGDRNSCLWAGDRGAGRKAAGVRAV